MSLHRWLILLLVVLAVCHAQAEYEYFSNATTMNEIHKLQAEFAKLGQEYEREMASHHRTNGVKAAAPSSSFFTAYCVGFNPNPDRVQIFRDRESCSMDGWETLMTFWISKHLVDKKVRQAKIKKGCVGFASSPSRSMLFMDHSDCHFDGWTHDFKIDFQGWGVGLGPAQQDNVMFWNHPTLGRMFVTPHTYYELPAGGWRHRYRLPVDMLQIAMTADQMHFLVENYPEHSDIHKRSLVGDSSLNKPGSTSVFRLLRHGIHYITKAEITKGNVMTLYDLWNIQGVKDFAGSYGLNVGGLRIDRQAGVKHTTAAGIVRHMVNIQLQYSTGSYAGILIQAGIYSTRIIAHGLTRSLNTGRMQTIHLDQRLGHAGRTIVEAVLIDGRYRYVISSWIKGDTPDTRKDL
ncbi:MAG: hypothetical protein J3R72DRAFT_530663 [Linnemannia gamsii]|nr:MAG: hypothetical protein J3R72DRAFT_530663 [Linnemannia gamsii]